MKTFALLFALVVLSAPASADPYDNQLTMAEWNVAPLGSRVAVSKALVPVLQYAMTPRPPSHAAIVYEIQLRMCVDAVAVEPRLGHLKLSDVAQSCAMKLGWQ